MKLFQIIVFYSALLLQDCMSYFYPPLFWHKDNCGFRRQDETKDPNVTKEYFIKVVPNNGMNVFCPSQATVNNWLKETGISSPSLLENMWLVDKEGYDKCMVNDKKNPKFNKKILVCDTPRKIKYKVFTFHPRFNEEEPRFAPGQHYYFISTSRGFKDELSSRKVSGRQGSCERYHMKLHIYVCNPKVEDCIWEIPRCDPPPELHREMLMIDGKLPAPTLPPVVETEAVETEAVETEAVKTTEKTTTAKPTATSIFRDQNVAFEETEASPEDRTRKMCVKKDKGVSIHLILNFVLGGVAFFMLIVIIILACGLSSKPKDYKVEQARSTSPSVNEPNHYAYVETLRYADLPSQLTPGHRLPPGSPFSNYLILKKADPGYLQQRTPQLQDGEIFVFPDVPDRSRTPTHVEVTTERLDGDIGPEGV